MARKIRSAVFALLAVATVWFIFSNSVQNGEESNLKSGWVAAFLRPILNPNGWLSDDTYHKLVRKLAHFTEFGLLGLWLGSTAANVMLSRKWLWAAGLCLLTAGADETIQAFTGRTNSLTDVCIDFTGAVCGIVFVWLLLRILRRFRGRTSWQN